MRGVGRDHVDVGPGLPQAQREGRVVENLAVGIENERFVAAGVIQGLAAEVGGVPSATVKVVTNFV